MSAPYFFLDFNAENACIYHNDCPAAASAKLIDGNGEDGRSVYELPGYRAEAVLDRTHYVGLSACRQITSVQNRGDGKLLLDSMSSLFVPGIGYNGRAKGLPAWHEKRFILHYAPAAWQGEAQWQHAYVEDMGLFQTYNHNCQTTIRFSSVGSWSTGSQYPLIFLEDTAEGETWYFEIESGTGWYIEVNAQGYKENSGLCVMLSSCHEKNDGWYADLKPGETVTSTAAVYGKVKGGFENAVADLTAYKRLTSRVAFPDGVVPVFFNDYMNCLWAMPTRERLEPLIRTAAQVGCEYFCIDAGWFGRGEAWYMNNGDWMPNDKLFGEDGLAGIIRDIQKAGMKPGVWLEIETVSTMSDFAKAHPDCLLTRHGRPIGGGTCFMDFRKQAVRDHLMRVFDYLYGIGVRFIKNDYNHSTGLSADGEDGSCNARRLRQHADAFYAFIDEVHEKHPGLIIENCGSGAMRCDHETLSHFAIQSTSDQEYYDRYPSIVQGMTACMPPERAGVWSYPYPLDFHERELQKEMFPLRDELKHIRTDAESGWQTAFNMVSAMMGTIYLSGRIPYADGLNLTLIGRAIGLYKRNRAALMNAFPVYPEGTSTMRRDGWTNMGLLNKDAGKLLLAVWRMRDTETTHTVDLCRYLTDSAKIVMKYPDLPGFAYQLKDGKLTVTLPKSDPNAACWFEIDV